MRPSWVFTREPLIAEPKDLFRPVSDTVHDLFSRRYLLAVERENNPWLKDLYGQYKPLALLRNNFIFYFENLLSSITEDRASIDRRTVYFPFPQLPCSIIFLNILQKERSFTLISGRGGVDNERPYLFQIEALANEYLMFDFSSDLFDRLPEGFRMVGIGLIDSGLAGVDPGESDPFVVVYQETFGSERIWVRPYSMFIDQKEVEGQLVERFSLVR